MKPVLDPDIWLHLRTGHWIAEHGTVPTTDPFSSYGMGKPWMADSWLFELLVYGLYLWHGLAGILLYRLVFSLAIVAALHRLAAKREPRFVVATGLVALAVLAIVPSLNERSWLFTILFFVLTLDVILDLRAGRNTQAVWLLPLMYALWANVHIQFVYGLFVLALACGAPLIDWLLGRSEAAEHAGKAGSREWWKLVALSGACCVATLLNPYHLRLYTVVVEYATQPGPYKYGIAEHAALDFRVVWDWAVLAITGLAAFALGRWAKKLSAFEVLLLVVAACFSFYARRDVWFVVIVALAVIVTSRSSAATMDRFALTKVRALLVAGGVVSVLLVFGWVYNLSERYLESVLAKIYPVAAAAVVEERGYPGPLYNHFNWGDYFIWRLPHLPVAMDGRTNLHGDERIARSFKTWAGGRDWASDPELTAARLVVAHVDHALTSLLRLDSRFELVYEDAVAAVFVTRQPPQGQEPSPQAAP